MYIAPNSIVRLLKGVTIDPTHENTIYFETKSAQTAYFVSKVKYTFERVSYQRANKGVVKVERNAESLYDCNYIMFQNLAFGNKWFYGFITDVEYINDTTAAVYYELDDIQTWFFDFSLNQCFVEREHATTDEVGDNLVPENLETGEYISVAKIRSGLRGLSSIDMSDFGFLCLATRDRTGENITSRGGFWYNGVFSGLFFNWFDDMFDFSSWATDVVQDTPECIVALYQIPRFMYDPFKAGIQAMGGDHVVTFSNTAAISTAMSSPTTFGSYTPRNKKLLTYPFNFLNVTNFNGKDAEFRYEFFNAAKGAPRFEVSFSVGASPTITLYPLWYKSPNEKNMAEQLVLNNLPICPYSTDGFVAWLAQNSGGIATALAGNLGSAGASLAMGLINPTLGAISVASSVANTLVGVQQHKIQAPQAHGAQGETANVQLGILDYEFSKVQITEEFARIIDSYFDRYGYATKMTKIPNRSTRPHWNYVKTLGCTISGSIPADAERRICEIHDAGVTYWRNGDEVGDYSLNNSIS